LPAKVAVEKGMNQMFIPFFFCGREKRSCAPMLLA